MSDRLCFTRASCKSNPFLAVHSSCPWRFLEDLFRINAQMTAMHGYREICIFLGPGFCFVLGFFSLKSIFQMMKSSEMEIIDLCSSFSQSSTAQAFSHHLAGAVRLVGYHTKDISLAEAKEKQLFLAEEQKKGFSKDVQWAWISPEKS